MLYNPEWKTGTKADPLSLGGLIAWLEKQPPNKHYDFNDCDGACLLGQYMASIGEPWSMSNYERLCGRIDFTAMRGCFPIGYARPHIFGSALKRARAVQNAD